MEPQKVLKLSSGFKINFILGTIFVPMLLASILFISFTLYFIGLVGVITLSVWTGIMKIKAGSIGHGVCLIIFGSMTYGIWPYIIAIINNQKYKNIITNNPDVFE